MEELPISLRGLKLQRDFITPEHEAKLIHIFRHELEWPETKQSKKNSGGGGSTTRLSLHYGYTFDYKTFGVDPDIPYRPFPDWLRPLIPRRRGPTTSATDTVTGPINSTTSTREDKNGDGHGNDDPHQVCLQYYPPGAGIPPHADTHSAYDELFALSLGSPVVMQFRRTKPLFQPLPSLTSSDGKPETEMESERETVEVDLPPRSMMQMSGDSRLHWEHGIKKRKKDVLPLSISSSPKNDNGGGDGGKKSGGGEGEEVEEAVVIRPRADRWSITFRWLREGGCCECGDVRLCDTAQRRAGVEREYRWKQQKLETEPDELRKEKTEDGEELGGKGGEGIGQDILDKSDKGRKVEGEAHVGSVEIGDGHRQENGNKISCLP